MGWLSEDRKTFFENIFIQPWFAALTTVIGVTAGALGSIFSNELKASFPFKWALIEPLKVFAFWGLLIAFGLLFFGVQWAHLRRTANAHKELTRSTTNITQSTESIRNVVQELLTLPPSGFLEQFKANFQDSIYISSLAINNQGLTKTEAALTVRTILDGVVSLAMLFHKDHQKNQPSRYAANIMLFKPIKNMAASEKEHVKKHLMFWEEKLDLNMYFGVLNLQEELSTSTDSREPVPDDSVGQFALVVPEIPIEKRTDKEHLKKTDLLPGAPWTFITKQVSIFVNAEKLLTVAKAGNFTPATINMIESYMKSPQGQRVRSFISIPIPSSDFDSKSDPIGTLNIHRDRDGLFAGNGLELFSPFIVPFCAVLSKLLERYESLPDN